MRRINKMKKCLYLIFTLLCCNSLAYPNSSDTRLMNTTKIMKNMAYGPSAQQVMDVYFPTKAFTDKTPAPIMVMVHGGARSIGDKNNAAVVKNKRSY